MADTAQKRKSLHVGEVGPQKLPIIFLYTLSILLPSSLYEEVSKELSHFIKSKQIFWVNHPNGGHKLNRTFKLPKRSITLYKYSTVHILAELNHDSICYLKAPMCWHQCTDRTPHNSACFLNTPRQSISTALFTPSFCLDALPAPRVHGCHPSIFLIFQGLHFCTTSSRNPFLLPVRRGAIYLTDEF